MSCRNDIPRRCKDPLQFALGQSVSAGFEVYFFFACVVPMCVFM